MVASIGPAGENLSYLASIMSDTRAAGRGGLGAVMGSKRVKAIAVKGLGKVRVANEDTYRRILKKLKYNIETHPLTGERDLWPCTAPLSWSTR